MSIRSTVFAALCALIFVSCNKDDESQSTRDVCLYVNNSQYDILFGKPHMISLHSGKQMEIDGFNEQSLDTMYMNLNLYYGDMAADKGHIIKVVDYAWAATSVDEVKEVVVLTRSHRFEFTDSLLEDITAKMAEKGNKPEEDSWFTHNF